ncbi:MAG: tetratricopeptide repeat protein [Planctomycetota bacterium]
MQTTQSSTNKNNPFPSLASGFGPVPTRIGTRPPLVVSDESAAATMKQQVVEMLHEFAVKIAVAHRSAAEAFLSQNLYKEALPHLEASVTFAPDDLEYMNQLGFVRYIAGDDQGAITAFSSVLERNPTSADAYFNLGMVLFGKSEFARAEECFARACDLRGDDAETWNNRGVCAHRLGRAGDAIVCFKRAMAIDSGYEDAVANLQAVGG